MHADVLFKTFLTRKKTTGKEFHALLIRNSKYMQILFFFFFFYIKDLTITDVTCFSFLFGFQYCV